MANLLQIEEYCNQILNQGEFEDGCWNGIQIENEGEIKKILGGVTLDMRTIDKALEIGASAILVHHGFFGKDLFTLRGRRRALVEKIIKNNLGVVGYHLPLDAHPEIGNNASLGRILGFKKMKGYDLGVRGELEKGMSLTEIEKVLGGVGLSTFCKKDIGNEIKRVVIVSGGGSSIFKYDPQKLWRPDFDLFIEGDWKEHFAEIGKELGFSYLALGHDASEGEGVKNLGEMIAKKFGIGFEFVSFQN